MKLVLVGGHLAPVLAVLDAIPKDCDVSCIGRKYALEGDQAVSLEYTTIHSQGIKFYTLTSGRLQRALTPHSFSSLVKIPYGFFQSFTLLFQLKPDVVLSFGGYLSVPVCFAAFFLGIPVVIHEQTLGAGLANRMITPLARRVCVSWETSLRYFPRSKTILTGNPIRHFSQKFAELPKGSSPLIFITGGSSGSHVLNVLVEGCIRTMVKRYRVIHQTGDAKGFADYERLKKIRDSLPENIRERYVTQKFIDPCAIGAIMEESTLIVSRAGINTVTEIMYAGKPCLLVPFPYGQSGEQMKNAQFLQSVGLASVVSQDKLTSDVFSRRIDVMIRSKEEYADKAKHARGMMMLDAAERVVKEVYAVAKQKK